MANVDAGVPNPINTTERFTGSGGGATGQPTKSSGGSTASPQQPSEVTEPKINPNNVGGEGGEYAGFVAPARPEAHTVAGIAGSYYAPHGETGNVFDRQRFSQTRGTRNSFSNQATRAEPAGPPVGRADTGGPWTTEGVTNTGFGSEDSAKGF